MLPTEGIRLMDGQTTLTTALKQGERKTLTAPICVTREGDQRIRMWVSLELSKDSHLTDRDTLIIFNYGSQTSVFEGHQYRGPVPTPPGYQPLPPGEVACK